MHMDAYAVVWLDQNTCKKSVYLFLLLNPFRPDTLYIGEIWVRSQKVRPERVKRHNSLAILCNSVTLNPQKYILSKSPDIGEPGRTQYTIIIYTMVT